MKLRLFFLFLAVCLVFRTQAQTNEQRSPILPEGYKLTDESAKRGFLAARLIWTNPQMKGDKPVNNEINTCYFSGKAPIAYSAIGFGWQTTGNKEAAGDFEIEIQARKTGGEWTPVHHTHGEIRPEDSPSAYYWSHLFYPDDGSAHSEFKVTFNAPNTSQVTSFQMVFTNLNDDAMGKSIAPANPAPTPSATCPPQMPVIMRDQWWGNLPPAQFSYTPTYQGVTHIFCHHTDGTNNPSNPMATIRAIWDYHVNTRGWTDIGYNYLFDHLGNIYQGRYNPQYPNNEVKGAHATVNNASTIGCSFMGTFMTIKPTTVTLNRATDFFAWECKKYNLDPTTIADKAGKLNYRICGHRDGAQQNTSCPGDSLWAYLPTFRANAKAILDACSTSAICNAPVSLNVTNITTFGATLNWGAVPTATGYTVSYRKVGTTTFATTTATGTSITVNNLTNNTAYEWQVSANCGTTPSSVSPVNTFTTLPLIVCAEPQTLTVVSTSLTSANVSWTAGAGVVSYVLRYHIVGDPNYTDLAVAGNQTSATINGLNPGMNYEFMVATVCSGVTSKYSAAKPFTTTSPCGNVSGLAVSQIAPTTATLSWGAISGATLYTVKYRIKTYTVWQLINTTSTSVNLANLTGATSYEWNVAASCACGVSSVVAGTDFTTLTPCPTPTGLAIANLTTSSVSLSWNAPTGANSYVVQYRATGATTWTSLNAASNSLVLTGLNPTTSYEWQVASVCSVGQSAYSASLTFTTLTPCGVPASLTTTAITTSGATLNWTAVSGATSYFVQYKLSGATTWTTVTATGTTYSLTGLTATTAYQWQVGANCNGSTSAYSAPVSFTTLTPCNAPTNLSSSSVTTTGAVVTWSNVATATSYTVYYKPSGAATEQQVTATGAAATLSGLSSTTTYVWRVVANCPSGASPTSANANFTTLTPCNAPTGLATVSTTTTSANINWTSVPTAASYTVYYKPSGATTEQQVTIATVGTTLSGLTPSTTYVWRVVATCPVGASPTSATANFTTLTPCGVPSGLVSSNVTTSTAFLSWTAVSGASSYTVYYRVNGGATWTTASTTGTTYSIGGLSASTTYEWQVSATCASGAGANSSSATFGTQADCYDAYETNNSSTAATVIPIGTPLSAKICGSTDVDWYKFILGAATNVRITLSNLPANYNLELYINSVFVTGSYNTGTTNDVIIRNAQAAGTLFFRVYGQSGATSSTLDYQVLVETSASTFRVGAPGSGDGNESAFLQNDAPVSRIYPNPTADFLNLEVNLPEESPLSVFIYDANGAEVLTQSFELIGGRNELPFQLNQLSAGVYLLQTRSRYGIENHKVLIQR